MDKKLGRGLNALIPDKLDDNVATENIVKIKINSIKPNSLQPRKKFDANKLTELKNSIKEKGVIQPVIVRKSAGGTYELIAGERRFRAVKELAYDEIPAIVKEVNDSDSLELSLIENIQREELNAMEEAYAYKDLLEKFNFSQDEISKAVGKDKSTVSNTLRLLTLPALIQGYVSDNLITMGHAKAILSLPTERSKIRFAKRIARNSLSVRQAEELIRQRLERATRKGSSRDEHLVSLEEEMQHHLGTRVKIVQGKKRGRIEIFYYSDDDLDRLIGLIKR
ncbi:MAG: ParB/RepB/Spo0J family partition protein [Candidatus Omnitrophica bacterium]|nr:ParB/RepB/Spo0J family partition protein [Candidatus Omnitrophota bacterium]